MKLMIVMQHDMLLLGKITTATTIATYFKVNKINLTTVETNIQL